MFANAIKNAILVLLIILIFHFMIKNHLMDVELCLKSNKPVLNHSQRDPIMTVNSEYSEPVIVKPKEIVHEITSLPSVGVEVTNKEELKDLYEFVYNDEQETNLLSEVFEDTPMKEISKIVKENGDCDIVCPQQNTETTKDFCMNKLDAHVKENSKNVKNDYSKPAGVLGTESKKTNDGFQILYEYDNATSDTLMGFETFESSFMML